MSLLSKQNQKSESAEPTVRKRQNVTKDATHSQTNSDYTKEQLEHVKRWILKIVSIGQDLS